MDLEPSVLRSGRATLEVLPHLGMLATSLRVDDTEFLAMPRTVEQYTEGRCTAMPLLHPWANRLETCSYPAPSASGQEAAGQKASGPRVTFDPTDVHLDSNGLPIHGTMQGLPFDIVAQSDSAITAMYEFGRAGNSVEVLKSFPFPHRITIDMEIATVGVEHRCVITTRVDNTGTTRMPISFGWHPFFVLPSRPRSGWTLRTPECARHELNELMLPTGRTSLFPELDDLIGDRTYDDHFALGDDRTFVIRDDSHLLLVRFDAGYPHLQIYLPGTNGLVPGDFVCIEPMTAPSNALCEGTAPGIDPGERYDATFSITVVELDVAMSDGDR